MVHFVVFTDGRLGEVPRFMDRANMTDNTVSFMVMEEATTRELGGAAFAHHLIWPTDSLVVVPSVLDLFSWDDEIGLYLPFYSSVAAAVAAMAECFHDIVVGLLTVPVPCQITVADMVGLDTMTWSETPGDATVQDWIDGVVPRVNVEIDVVNAWNYSPNVPLGSRVHMTRRTVDGTLAVHDYRAFPDGFSPSRRQVRRWARSFANLLEEFVEDQHRN